MKIEFEQQEAQAIVDYLITKPFREVAQFIQLIQSKVQPNGEIKTEPLPKEVKK